MDLDMVFNELSTRTLAPDISIARQWMSEFISTMLAAQRCGMKGIRTQRDFHATVLAGGYPLARWRNDTEVSREERTFLRTLATKAPLLVDISDSEIQKNVEDQDCEFSIQGNRVEGLKTAFWLETLAISLNSESLWNCSRLELEVTKLDDKGNLIEEREYVRHASHKNHVIEYDEWIKNRLQPRGINGIELWNQREQLFPNMTFCKAGNRQLQRLRTGEKKLQLVLEVLDVLNNCAKNWQTGRFSLDGYPFEESGESEPTINKYWKERTFLCPDGEERLFERHVKLKECNWRIHFFPEVKTTKVIIGYVGIHLPTDQYPT